MIIPFLKEHFRIISEALIIAGFVIAFALFDPFGWFSSRTKIRNTPVAVESIRQIGQLTTAEYYGEVIASLSQGMTDTIEPAQINAEGQAVFNRIIIDLDSLKSLERKNILSVKKKNIGGRMDENFPWLTRNQLYILTLNYLKDTIKARSKKSYERKEILWKLYKNGRIAENALTVSKNFQFRGFYSFVKRTEKEQLREINNNIAYIGRGWVKAGIDFGILKAGDISYNTGNKTIYIKNCETKILDCNINPWFIPGKVKGYELIKEKGSFKNPFAEAVKVKKQCVENLRVQAMKSGILEQANQNAKESLKNLFSLLTGDEITDVVFTVNKFDRILKETGKDKLISDQEAALINDLIQRSLEEVDTLAYTDYRGQLADLRKFCKSLQQYRYAGSPVNGYSLDLAAFIKNDTVSPFHIEEVAGILSQKNVCDSIRIKHKMFGLMAQPDLSQNNFTDSCFASGILKTGKTKAGHKLSCMSKNYRDSIFSAALQTCTRTLKNPDNRYAVWFKDEAESDSTRCRLRRYLSGYNSELQEK